MTKKGLCVYSPITMTHPLECILQSIGESLTHDEWIDFDQSYMNVCSACVVLKLPGWDKSKGVKREIEYFTGERKPIHYVEPDSDWKAILFARILLEPGLSE